MMSSPSAPPTAETTPAGDEPATPGIDLTHGEPPPELLDQMARADEINTRLRASGRELRFALSADGCAVEIELCDSAGNLLRRLSIDEAIAIAEGAPAE